MPRLAPSPPGQPPTQNSRPRKPFDRPGLGAPPPANPLPMAEDLGYSSGADPLSSIGASESSPITAADSQPPFTPLQAGYTSSQDRCSGCSHFRQPSTCEYVQGVIDPEGSCSLHSSLSAGGGGIGEPAVVEEPVEEMMETPTLDNPVEEAEEEKGYL